jgi:UDP-GlcNAc:undecaprenyl-phosphate/decaprenyl-phosphate GlcNAc-1-phosphate transferase
MYATVFPVGFAFARRSFRLPGAGISAMLIIFLDVIAIAACWLICINADAIGRRLRVMDYPDRARKNHPQPTPLVGGIGILVPLLIWLAGVLVAGDVIDSRFASMLILCAAGVGLAGFADDQTSTSPLSRILSLLVFLGVAMTLAPGLIAHSLNWGSFDPTPLPPTVYAVLIALTAAGIVNAVNMADGQNGLVPSMFVIWSLCLALAGDRSVAPVAEVIAAVGAVILCYNLRGKLFLGDCGSYGVTFVLGLLALAAYAHGAISIETVTVWFYIPVVDCLRLLIVRRVQGRSPFAPDNDHFHHRLQVKLGPRYGLAAYLACVAVSSFAAVLAPRFSLVCLIVLTAIYFSFAFLTDAAADAQQSDAVPGNSPSPDFSNVVPLGSPERSKWSERA